MTKEQYHPTKLRPLVGIVAKLARENPELIDDADAFMEELSRRIPTIRDKTKCPNCGASMAQYVFNFDILDALLLLAMAQKVRANMGLGMMFTEANKVKVQQLAGVTYAAKSRTTQCAKLGLIAKLKGKDGKQVPGTWVITKRGYTALSGQRVPKSVMVFRGQILERAEDQTTMPEVLQLYSHKIRGIISKGKSPKVDLRRDFEGYNHNEWVHIAGMNQGELF